MEFNFLHIEYLPLKIMRCNLVTIYKKRVGNTADFIKPPLINDTTYIIWQKNRNDGSVWCCTVPNSNVSRHINLAYPMPELCRDKPVNYGKNNPHKEC